ncbi:hypothetical protein EC960428_5325, partial [Escherichia coli 96.0428]
MEQEAVINKAQ